MVMVEPGLIENKYLPVVMPILSHVAYGKETQLD